MNKKTTNEKKETNLNHSISTQIKDLDLIEKRRKEIVDAVVPLFIEKGFHKTTTRQIAKAANFSIGTLYEYVTSKEDVLYLVCQAIHDEVKENIGDVLSLRKRGRDALSAIIYEYFMICHRMSDVILLMYQETHSLPEQWRQKVLTNELNITELIRNALKQLSSLGKLKKMTNREINLIAHNIIVLGQMWTFRRWALGKDFTIEEYISYQTKFISQLYSKSSAKSK